jgi:hypothetical protein
MAAQTKSRKTKRTLGDTDLGDVTILMDSKTTDGFDVGSNGRPLRQQITFFPGNSSTIGSVLLYVPGNKTGLFKKDKVLVSAVRNDNKTKIIDNQTYYLLKNYKSIKSMPHHRSRVSNDLGDVVIEMVQTDSTNVIITVRPVGSGTDLPNPLTRPKEEKDNFQVGWYILSAAEDSSHVLQSPYAVLQTSAGAFALAGAPAKKFKKTILSYFHE